MNQDESKSRSERAVTAADGVPTTWLDPLLTGPDAVLKGPGPYTGNDIENLLRAVKARVSTMEIVIRSELTRSVAVKDMEIIGHREPGDAHKGRAWWSGGTWLQPGEVVAVLTLPKQDERHSADG